MNILIFDTETTGLPEKDATVFQHNKWPYIVQLSYVLYNLASNDFKYRNDYIKIDDNIVMNEKSFEIHKLSKEFLNANGIPITDALKWFNHYLDSADIIVGHNLSFDKKIVLVECFRNKIPQRFSYNINNTKHKKAEFCTMKNGKHICNIVRYDKLNRRYLKTPSLKELFTHLFPDEILPNNLHNAFIDILITFRCYYKMVTGNDVIEINEDIKREYNNNLTFE